MAAPLDTQTTADVLVIGGGLIGATVAAALTDKAAGTVLVLERDTVGGGMTGKSSGVVRCHYGVEELASMAWWSLPILEHAEEILGAEVGFEQVGYVVAVDERNAGALRENVALHQRLGIEVELYDPDALHKLWPGIKTDDLALGAYEPRGGYGDAYGLATAQAQRARVGGATIRQGTSVRRLVTSGDGSRVTGAMLDDGTEITAGTVVLAAGAWSVPLAASVGLELPIRAQREVIVMVAPRTPLAWTPPVFSDLVQLQYTRPERSGQLLVGNSDHSEPELADPDHYSNIASHASLERTLPKVMSRFPVLEDAGVASSYAGCYDVTPDYNPIICPAGPEGLVVAAGFSGHGFKISPAVGELVASIVTSSQCRVPHLGFDTFALERFAAGQPLVSRRPYVGAGQMR